MLEMKEE